MTPESLYGAFMRSKLTIMQIAKRAEVSYDPMLDQLSIIDDDEAAQYLFDAYTRPERVSICKVLEAGPHYAGGMWDEKGDDDQDVVTTLGPRPLSPERLLTDIEEYKSGLEVYYRRGNKGKFTLIANTLLFINHARRLCRRWTKEITEPGCFEEGSETRPESQFLIVERGVPSFITFWHKRRTAKGPVLNFRRPAHDILRGTKDANHHV